MGKIIGSFLLKVHEHTTELGDQMIAEAGGGEIEPPTIDVLKEAVVKGLADNLGGEWTVSLAERTDD